MKTREQWLEQATRKLRPMFKKLAGVEVPADVRVSCSWPGGGSARKRIGECWPRSFSEAGVNEVFISPSIADSVRCLDILVHELVHAIDDCKSGHKGEFRRIAVAVGLEGKMTATVAGDELKAALQKIVDQIGEYPHKQLKLAGRKKQSTRMLKCKCNECGAVWRMSSKYAYHAEWCPICGEQHCIEVGG